MWTVETGQNWLGGKTYCVIQVKRTLFVPIEFYKPNKIFIAHENHGRCLHIIRFLKKN